MRIEDAFCVADIHTRAWQVAYKGILDQKLLDTIDVMEREVMWRDKLIPNEDRTNLVLEVEAEIKGWSAFGRSVDDSEAQELIGIYVDPLYFREGVGTELWRATSEHMLKQSPKKLVLWVLEENKQARYFYEKMGLGITGETRKVNWLGDATEVQYTKQA